MGQNSERRRRKREKLRFHSMWELGGAEGMMGILPERNEGREAERGGRAET